MKKLVRITTVPQSLWKLLEGQLKFMAETFDVHAVSSPGEKLEIVKNREGVQTHAIPMTRQLTPFRDLVAIWKLYRLLRRLRPTVVHTHTPKAGLVGMIAARLARVPVRMHTIAGLPVESRSGRVMRRLLMGVERLTYACAHWVYPNSHGIREFILSHRLCKPEKVKIIGRGSSNGIDLDHFKPNKVTTQAANAIRAKIDLQDKDTLLCFIGRAVKEKGIEELMWAFDQLTRARTGVHLAVLGKFEQHLSPISSQAMEMLNEHPNVHFFGYQDDVRPYLQAADLFVFPSYREGLPNVLLQAGAMGTPAVATRINGNTDIIEDGVNGVLVPAQNAGSLLAALEKTIDDPGFRTKLAIHSREIIAARYDQKCLWVDLQNEYQRLVNV